MPETVRPIDRNKATPVKRTRTYLPPGCLHCGRLYATRAEARTHVCAPAEREAWQETLRQRTPAPGMVDLGNAFVLRLPEEP